MTVVFDTIESNGLYRGAAEGDVETPRFLKKTRASSKMASRAIVTAFCSSLR